MQDFTGVPAVVDLAAMRDAMVDARRRPGEDQPAGPGRPRHRPLGDGRLFRQRRAPSSRTSSCEYERNGERYDFLRWGQSAFDNFRVVPPGTGICHQVNLEYLAQTVWTGEDDGATVAYPDTLVGTDSHTTMVNGLAVLGWGVGGIEAEAAMLGQPISMLIPEVVGFKLTGTLPEGATATDLVLTVTQMLRKKGVVGKFVEFYGAGLVAPVARGPATIANMAPEYGATCGFFPVDKRHARLSQGDRPRRRARRAGRGLRQGAGHVARPTTRPTRSSPTRWSSTSPPSCRRSPGRSARRTASRSPTPTPPSRRRWPTSATSTAPTRPPTWTRKAAARCRALPLAEVDGKNYDLGRRRRGHRRHHLLHQHLQPVAC